MSKEEVQTVRELLEEYHRKVELSHQEQARVTSVAWGELKDEIRGIRGDVRTNADNISKLVNAVSVFKEKHRHYDTWVKSAKTLIVAGIIGLGAWIWKNITH